jgi:ankyrin repeat protein
MAMPWLHISSQRAARLLHLAANKGHFPLFELLHARLKYDANAKDSSGWTVLMDAVRSGNLPVVQALLAGPGIDLAVRDKYDRTALKMAIEKDVPAIIDALLAAQDINVGSKEFLARHREFLAAAEAGNLAQVRSLLANLPWLDVNFKESDQTALKLAVGKSHLEVVQALLATPGIVVDRDTCAKIAHLATQKGHLPLLRRMMDRPEFDVNKGYREPYLITAAENGHFPLVQALLAAPGINVNAGNSGNTALYAACKNNHYQIAMLLAVTPGIDVNASKEYFGFGYFYDIVSQKWSPLKLAAVRGNLRLVRALLDAERIDVNVLDKDKLTPLMHAAHHGHLEIVRALLAMPGIDVHHCSDYVPSHVYGSGMGIKGPFSALSLAEWAGERQIVEALLAMPVSLWFPYSDLHKSLLERSRRAPLNPEKKQIPEQTYRFLHRILHPGFDAGSPLPLLSPDQQQRPSWLEQKCMDVSIGTCPVTDVPFLLKSTMPLPAWCQAALANAIALGFTAGHYRSAPAPLWKPLQEGQAWLAGLAFGASESRQDAIELDAGIGHELEAMGLWYDFLNTVETLRKLKADPDGVHLDSLTLLGWAARDGDLPMIRYLVALGANIHLRSPNGDAPILAAARAGQWAACAELLSLGAMPYRVDRNGYPALFHIASTFANSDTASPALAKLIRYLRLKNVRFDIPVPNPDEEDRTKNPTVLVSDILVSNPEPWVLFGKDIFGVREAPLPALAEVPALPAAQPMAPMAPRADIRAMVQSADPVAAVAAWLDADPRRLRWQDPANGEGLLHLAAAAHDIGLVRLLLDRGVDRRHADHAGRTAAQLLPAEYMSSHTSAVADIAALLR